ncbi:hypothetical protein IW261DRAFT_1425481 [Armillaria novae-zelandiae]|uniref:Uncharacterized protein n=1 Tax=Armillaria novae-zelandiae TaxID=153914 RepID=A0AA39TZT5_9AGAR|nr:hypothetical protein IW261DRAFT_1425481 [Armillaria novae-zelandiae]
MNQTREAGQGHRQRKENTEALAGHYASLAKSNKIHEAGQRRNVHANDSPIDVATNIDRVAGISTSETTSSEAPSRCATLNTTPITTSTRSVTAPTQASASNTPVDTSTTSAGPSRSLSPAPSAPPSAAQKFPGSQDASQNFYQPNNMIVSDIMHRAPMTAAVARFSAHARAQRSAPFEMIDPPNQVGPNLNLGSMYTNHGQPFTSSGRNRAALRPTEDFLNDLPSHGDPDATNLEPFQFPSHEMDDFIQANIMDHGTLYGGTNFDMPFIDPLELGSRGHTNVGGNESGRLLNTITSSQSQAGMALDHDDNDVHGSESWHDVKLSDDLSQLSNDQDLDSDTGSTLMPYQTDTRKFKRREQSDESESENLDQLPVMKHRKKRSHTINNVDENCQVIIKQAYNEYKRLLMIQNAFPIDTRDNREASYMLAMAWDAACDHLDLDNSEITDPTAQEENLVFHAIPVLLEGHSDFFRTFKTFAILARSVLMQLKQKIELLFSFSKAMKTR